MFAPELNTLVQPSAAQCTQGSAQLGKSQFGGCQPSEGDTRALYVAGEEDHL